MLDSCIHLGPVPAGNKDVIAKVPSALEAYACGDDEIDLFGVWASVRSVSNERSEGTVVADVHLSSWGKADTLLKNLEAKSQGVKEIIAAPVRWKALCYDVAWQAAQPSVQGNVVGDIGVAMQMGSSRLVSIKRPEAMLHVLQLVSNEWNYVFVDIFFGNMHSQIIFYP